MPKTIYERVQHNGETALRFSLHAGQRRALASPARIVAILSGARAGKTSFAPLWLEQEMRRQGPGDYLIAGPTFPIIDKAAAPEIEALFGREMRLGELRRFPTLQFVFSREGQKALWGTVSKRQPRIIFGHADDPDSLEAMTARAAWIDEAGQKKFRVGSFEAIIRRLSIHQGRLLITTTPYQAFGWLKTQIWDRWRAGDKDIEVIQFTSLMNPAFPRAEYERAEKILPPWKFAMFYKGELSKPAGMIYDCFDEVRHTVPRHRLPEGWTERYLGLDFGGVNTAAVHLAREPLSGKLFLYRTYKAGNRTAREHVEAILQDEPYEFVACVGGSHSEGQWRQEFAAAGLRVREPPIKDVEVGINRAYSFFREDRLAIFMDEEAFLEELQSYSREVDDAGQPTEKIDDKSAFHHLDALRYITAWLHDYDQDTGRPSVLGTKAQ